MNSYQKLKEENKKLRNDIYLLIRGTFLQKHEIKEVYDMKFALADVCMHGSRGNIDQNNSILQEVNCVNLSYPVLKTSENKTEGILGQMLNSNVIENNSISSETVQKWMEEVFQGQSEQKEPRKIFSIDLGRWLDVDEFISIYQNKKA